MPLNYGKSKSAFKENVRTEIGAGKPPKQAVAIAYSVQRRANGGPVSHLLGREETGILGHSGFLNGLTGGRADAVETKVDGGSYIIPADVVSGIGQGNSIAGAHAFNRLFKMGPYETPAAPHLGISKHKFAAGGSVDVALSDGEFSVPPEKVAEIGGGDMKRGHDVLDKLVLHVRKKAIKTLRKLPGPKKR